MRRAGCRAGLETCPTAGCLFRWELCAAEWSATQVPASAAPWAIFLSPLRGCGDWGFSARNVITTDTRKGMFRPARPVIVRGWIGDIARG